MRRAGSVGSILFLVTVLLVAVPSAAGAAVSSGAVLPDVASVPVSPVVAHRDTTPSPVDAAAMRSVPAVSWPAGGVADIAVAATGSGAALTSRLAAGGSGAATVGGLTVVARGQAGSLSGLAAELAGRARRADGAGRADVVASGRVAAVRLRVADQATAVAAGVRGVLFTAARADGGTGPASVGLDVSYAGFKDAYGGDFGSRLRLVSLPACVLSTPRVPACQSQTPVAGGRRSLDALTVSTDALAVGAAGSVDTVALAAPTSGAQRREWANSSVGSSVTAPVYALAGAPASNAGDWSASPLSASSSWTAGSSGGDFSWSYPLRVPPGLGGPTPDLKITYSSGSVDGRTGGANAQPSWVGEGFDLALPFVERSYLPCTDDGHTGIGDLCWSAGNTVTLVFGGRAMAIVKDSTTGAFRPAFDDDGLRIDHGYNAPNGLMGATNGEYWVVTKPDGTRYFFGSHRIEGSSTAATNSALRVPVFGDDAGNECYSGVFSTSYCKQGWRWNLDYVVDARGNTMTLYWTKQVNHYAINAVGREDYERAALLDKIEYGQRYGAETPGTAPMQVLFSHTQRCLPSVSCLWNSTPSAYPDTPWDQHCDATGACANISPTFWSHERLDSVTTQVYNPATSAYVNVDTWQLAQEYPSPGDGTSSMLYLRTIAPSGWDPATSAWVAGPVTQFDSYASLFANRVDYNTSAGVPPLNKWRVNRIDNGVGGQVWVGYSAQDCSSGSLPANAHTNTRRCFPQWTTNGSSSGFGWFHKYVVTSVTDRDLTGSPTAQDYSTFYSYATTGSTTGVLWAHDTSQLNPARQTWSQWRGYSEVTSSVGPSGGQQTRTVSRYLRGFHTDKADPSGTIRYVTVTDLDGGGVTDFPALQGRLLDQVLYNGANPVSGTITDYVLGQTAAQTGFWSGTGWTAFRTWKSQTRARTWLAAGGTRGRTMVYTYNTLNQVTSATDAGDPTVSTDDSCVTTTYVTALLLSLPSVTKTFDKACSAVTGTDKEIAGTTNFYDGATVATTSPTQGLVTRVDQASGALAATVAQTTVSTTTYDAYGRVLTSKDGLNHTTTTGYTPSTGSAATMITVTNAATHLTTTTINPRWGLPTTVVDPNGKTTQATYDPFGRLAKVWLPGRSTTLTPNLEYAYTLRSTGANAVTTRKLGPTGVQIVSYALYDGLLRARQTQAPAPVANGGRVIVDTVYDPRGLVAKTSTFWNAASTPTDTLVTFADSAVNNQTRLAYDDAGRQTSTQLWSANAEKWRTSTAYGGDRTSVTPPAGGTATTTLVDTRDNKTALWQYTAAASPTGAHQDTTYTYDKLNQLTGITDPAGNAWSYTYDRQGHQTSTVDPDAGTTTSTYDAVGNVTSTTDNLGVLLSYEYNDSLGRKTSLWRDAVGTGTKRASWTYDTVTGGKGQVATSTRWEGANGFVTAVTGYSDTYQPTSTTVTFPASEGTLSTQGPWITGASYNVDGSIATQILPAGGGLAAETVTTGYDANGFVTSSTSGLGAYLSSISYYGWGPAYQTVSGAAGKQVRLTTNRDEASGRLTSGVVETQNQTTSTLWDEKRTDTYGYDNSGNVTSTNEVLAGTVVSAQCFGYDTLTHLVDAYTNTTGTCTTPTTPTSGPDPYRTNWIYNSVGNRTQQTRYGLGGAANTVTNYAYPAPTAARPHTLTSATTTGPGAGTDTYGYDNAGNTTGRTVAGTAQTLTWDAEGHLATQVTGTQTTSYLYDTGGNRLLRRDPDGSTTAYLAGYELKRNTAGVLACTRYYAVAGKQIASRTAAGLTWFATDQHSTAQVSIAASTLTTTTRRSMPFGETRATAPTWANDKGFVGGTADPTGLTHLGAREYDPGIGRFVSDDPIIDRDSPQQHNGYTYANSAPTTVSDPDGKRPACDDDNGQVHACKPGEGGYQPPGTPGTSGPSPGSTPVTVTIVLPGKGPGSDKNHPTPDPKPWGDGRPIPDNCTAIGSTGSYACVQGDVSSLNIKMVGICMSSSVSAYIGYSGSMCIGADANGIGFFGTDAISEGTNFGANLIGFGPVFSNGTVADQADAFSFVEGGGGWGYSVNGSYSWGTGQQGQDVWTVQVTVNAGGGAGYSGGTSNTTVAQPWWGKWQY